jgi:hypothetical protein
MNLEQGNSLDSLYILNTCTSHRVSSWDRSGGNHDWIDLSAGETVVLADIGGCGVIRHIWCTVNAFTKDGKPTPQYLRKIVLRAWWDEEAEPSIQAPVGDFFGMGHALCKDFASEPLSMNPKEGKGFCCYFPMPFESGAHIMLENQSEGHVNFYYYIDYEEHGSLPEGSGRFHAQYRQERDTMGWAPREAGWIKKEMAAPPDPAWMPKAWTVKNTNGNDNYVILNALGKGKYVGYNLNIDVFERQANDWYGEGDDMIFIDGEIWPPSLHGTGTEDYFNTAFCPRTEFCTLYQGITLYSGKDNIPWYGKNSMYRFHIKDPVHFSSSIRVTIEHGHANKLSNDYSSTAYWYQQEPHLAFEPFPNVEERLAR